MATEIERKFLVKNDLWRGQIISQVRMKQGYVSGGENATVRIRVAGEQAWLTIKSTTQGIRRLEFEYTIPTTDAEQMLMALAKQPFIDKTRYKIRQGSHVWELDVFEGENQGLVMAELELESEDERFETPPWAGEEVSGDPRYYNSSLAKRPYSSWAG